MLVSRFRNSHDLYIELRRISESRGTSHLLILVSFGFEVRPKPDIYDVANFETTTLAGSSARLAERGQAQLAGAGENGIFQLVRRVGAGLGILPDAATAGLAEHHHLQRVGPQRPVHDVDRD